MSPRASAPGVGVGAAASSRGPKSGCHICWAAYKPGSGVPAPHRRLHVTGGRTWHSCLLSATGISSLSQRPWLLWPRGRPLGRCPGKWAPVTFLESAREPQRLSAPAPGATLTLTDPLEPPAGPSPMSGACHPKVPWATGPPSIPSDLCRLQRPWCLRLTWFNPARSS